jgi:uncharacterized protein DUF4307
MTAPARQPGGELLADRYGIRPRKTSRRTYWILGACALLLGGVIAWVGYVNLGSSPIETEQVGFVNLPHDEMRFTFDVTRDTPERPAVCIVRTRVRSGEEGGRREVLVPPGPDTTRVTTTIKSGAEPVTADVFGCSYQVPSYLSTPVRPSE